jgi:hypothetical protein
MTKQEKDTLVAILNPSDVKDKISARIKALRYLNAVEIGTRTKKQNDSFHLWLDQVAEEMDKHGVTVQNVVARIQKAEIRPTGDNLKEVLWRPYQIAATGKESSTQLNKAEIDRIYEGLNKFIGEHWHFHIPFPSDNERALANMTGYKNAAGTQGDNYPEMTEELQADRF